MNDSVARAGAIHDQESPGLRASISTVGELLARESLAIPDYQRPYTWTVKNADQLLEDIWRFRNDGAYRLGTVILHEDNIVDGQQRFLTLNLLMIALLNFGDEAHSRHRDRLAALRARTLPEHGQRVSLPNLQANFVHLQSALALWTASDRATLADLVLDHCQVVVLELTDLDAAFQMFDSQNTRGRALFATDLLKAFHIREMRGQTTSADVRAEMVHLWESIPPDAVNALFSDYLFKVKRWANGLGVPPQGFGTGDVGMFKGIREGDPANAHNRWSMPFLFAKNYTDDYRSENSILIRYGALPAIKYPFQIDQPVLNGETFFELVAHYYRVGLAMGIFPADTNHPVGGADAPFDSVTMTALRDLRADLQQYSTDRRFDFVINLIDCLLLYYLDRFSGQDLQRAIRFILRYAMGLRAKMKQLQRVTVNNYALGTSVRGRQEANLFSDLRQASSVAEFLMRPLPPKPDEWGSYEDQLAPYFADDSTAIGPDAKRGTS